MFFLFYQHTKMNFGLCRIRSLIVLVVAYALAEGETDTGTTARIINGQEVDIKSYPYMAQIIHDSQLLCAATVIDEKFLLTSASCFDKTKPKETDNFKVYVGNSQSQKGESIEVNKIIQHERFVNLQNFTYADIALVELKSKITFGETVKAIEVNYKEKTDITEYKKCIMLGWGDTKSNAKSNRKLQFVKLKPMTFQKCKARHESIFASNICADGFNKGHSCDKDVGAPMVCSDVLIGVLNAVVLDCTRKTPEIFTKTEGYEKWIKGKMSGGKNRKDKDKNNKNKDKNNKNKDKNNKNKDKNDNKGKNNKNKNNNKNKDKKT